MKKSNNKIVVINPANADKQHGFAGNTGIVASLIVSGRTFAQTIRAIRADSDLTEIQIRVALGNLKNRSKLFTLKTQAEFTIADRTAKQESHRTYVDCKTKELRETDTTPASEVNEDVEIVILSIPPKPIQEKQKVASKKPESQKTKKLTLVMKKHVAIRTGTTKYKVYSVLEIGKSKEQVIKECIEIHELTLKQVKTCLANIEHKTKIISFN